MPSEHVDKLVRIAMWYDAATNSGSEAIDTLKELLDENAALRERLRITNELLEAKQEPNNAE